ncbi:MAG: SDR family NAD(P)-dependent oxidoreductase [bacterium]
MKADMMDKFRRKSVLITGASKGVGKAIAESLSLYNMKLGLMARSENLLKQVAEDAETKGSEVLVLPVDLRKMEEMENAVKEFKGKFGTPDFLINNAGFGFRSFWNGISLDTEIDMIAVNYTAPVILIRSFLPDMISKKRGHIININSISGLYASPYLASYCASKAALLAYSTSLAYELEKTDVRISSIFSGAIDTEFSKNYKGFQKKKGILSPYEVAEKVLSLMIHPKERLFIASFIELLAIKIANLNPLFFRKIIESKNTPPEEDR